MKPSVFTLFCYSPIVWLLLVPSVFTSHLHPKHRGLFSSLIHASCLVCRGQKEFFYSGEKQKVFYLQPFISSKATIVLFGILAADALFWEALVEKGRSCKGQIQIWTLPDHTSVLDLGCCFRWFMIVGASCNICIVSVGSQGWKRYGLEVWIWHHKEKGEGSEVLIPACTFHIFWAFSSGTFLLQITASHRIWIPSRSPGPSLVIWEAGHQSDRPFGFPLLVSLPAD